MKIAEDNLEISVEFISGDNSYWTPTPPEEVEELNTAGIIDIGEDQSEFEKLISLVHEIGHVIYHNNRCAEHKRILIFEESLAWKLGYDYALVNNIEIDLGEYSERIEKALQLYVKEIK
tara:strand:- start:938 stop:1294 length:357 start_codon:yes stop_codon:yes gene_type:complete